MYSLRRSARGTTDLNDGRSWPTLTISLPCRGREHDGRKEKDGQSGLLSTETGGKRVSVLRASGDRRRTSLPMTAAVREGADMVVRRGREGGTGEEGEVGREGEGGSSRGANGRVQKRSRPPTAGRATKTHRPGLPNSPSLQQHASGQSWCMY